MGTPVTSQQTNRTFRSRLATQPPTIPEGLAGVVEAFSYAPIAVLLPFLRI